MICGQPGQAEIGQAGRLTSLQYINTVIYKYGNRRRQFGTRIGKITALTFIRGNNSNFLNNSVL